MTGEDEDYDEAEEYEVALLLLDVDVAEARSYIDSIQYEGCDCPAYRAAIALRYVAHCTLGRDDLSTLQMAEVVRYLVRDHEGTCTSEQIA